ncbi:hypothetical protein GQ42DRAFT_87354 [Ramicandelaber brevisporus]|nr:hypothetical protein GQ42DRAFT_87354 [Ramicandelaber brevisporus]
MDITMHHSASHSMQRCTALHSFAQLHTALHSIANFHRISQTFTRKHKKHRIAQDSTASNKSTPQSVECMHGAAAVKWSHSAEHHKEKSFHSVLLITPSGVQPARCSTRSASNSLDQSFKRRWLHREWI